MSSCNMKTKAIMVVLVGLFGLLCVGFGISVTQKYKLQKERVHGLERQLAAGRKEVLKVPEMIENLDKANVAKKEVEDKFTACAAEKDGLAAKAAELQKKWIPLALSRWLLVCRSVVYRPRFRNSKTKLIH